MSAFQQALAAASTSQQQGESSSLSIRGSSSGAPSNRGLASALRGIKKDGTPGMEVDGMNGSRSPRGMGRGRRVTIGADGATVEQVSCALHRSACSPLSIFRFNRCPQHPLPFSPVQSLSIHVLTQSPVTSVARCDQSNCDISLTSLSVQIPLPLWKWTGSMWTNLS